MAVSLGASWVASSIGGSAMVAGWFGGSVLAAQIFGTMVAGALVGKLTNKEQPLADLGILLNKSANDAAIPIVYGLRRVGGTRVFIETTGEKNNYLHVVIAVCEGEIDGFNAVYLNDIDATDSRFDGVLDIVTKNGTDDQTGIVINETDWGTAHALKGCAYIYAKLKFDRDTYPQGLPTITVDIKGAKVYDPRDNSTDWSDNPALCIRDYLTNGRYGRAIESSLMDDASFSAAATYCDNVITIGNSSKKRFTCNGVINTDDGSMEVLKGLLTSCRGFLVFSGGKYKLIIDKPEVASFTFSESNIVGAWSIKLGDKNTQFNRIRGRFFNPDRQWQPDIAVVDAPELRTNDSGLLLDRMIDLPFTSDISRAKMISTINLHQSRQQVACEFSATIEALTCEVGDVVAIKHSTPGWDKNTLSNGKLFRIMRMTLQNNDEVRVLAIEYDSETYNFGTIHASDTSPNTRLPDPTNIGSPTAIQVIEELYKTNTSQGLQMRANLSWSEPLDAYVDKYEVEYMPPLITGEYGSDWIYSTTTRRTTAQINNLQAGDYRFRVRAINIIGVKSSWYSLSKGLSGLSAAPLPLQNFSVRAIDGSAHIQWARVTDLDVLHGGYIRIRHTPLTAGATWAHGTQIGEALPGTATNVVLPLLSGTYMARSVDSAGNASTDYVQSITTVPNILSFNAIETLDEKATGYGGTKTNLTIDGSSLKLTENSGFAATSGVYLFESPVDLGSVFTARITSKMTASIYDIADLIDSRVELIDDWAEFDGQGSDNVKVSLFVATTKNDPNISPAWSDWEPLMIGDYSARGFKFKVDFENFETSLNIVITELVVSVDMPDRNERDQNKLVGTGGLNTVYASPFMATPYVGITAQNMVTGDYWTLTNETKQGFTINFKNSTGAAVSRRINWMATGYGRAE